MIHANGFDVSGSPFAITQGSLIVNDGNGGNNYAITYNSANLTLAAKALTDTGFAAANKTYDGTTAATITSDGSLSGVVSGDTVSINNGSASATFSDKHVGTGKTVTAAGYALSGAQAGDYTLSAQPTTTADITARGLTVTASNQTKTYASDSLGNSAFTSSGLQNGETIGSVTLTAVDINTLGTSTSGNRNAGVWRITPSAATGGTFTPSDYSITYANAPTGLTVNPLGLTITGLSGTNKVYDGLTSDTVTGSPTLNTVVTNDLVTLNNGTASFADKNVGNNKTVAFSGYSVSGHDAGDYSLSQPANSTANITAKAITVTADAESGTYGGNVPTLTYSNSGLAAGDSFTGTLTTAHGGAGTQMVHANGFDVSGSPFAITQGSLIVNDGNGGNNYSITYNSNNLTLAAKSLTDTGFAAANKTYDGTTAATITADGSLTGGSNGTNDGKYITGDTVSINNSSASATFDNKNAGTAHTVTASGYSLSGAQAGDYILTAPSASPVTISPASLTVTADNESKKQGASDPVLAYTYSGLVGGDTSASFTGGLTRDPGETAGNYAIRLGTLAGTGNYTIGPFSDGAFTIESGFTTQTLPPSIQAAGNQNNQAPPPQTPSTSRITIEVDARVLTPDEWARKPNNPKRWWDRIRVVWGE
jgi:hypothetical protein